MLVARAGTAANHTRWQDHAAIALLCGITVYAIAYKLLYMYIITYIIVQIIVYVRYIIHICVITG